MHAQDYSQLKQTLQGLVGTANVISNEPMSAHTTFKLGGPAALFVAPPSAGLLAPVLEAVRDAGVPHFVLGCGSDLLVGDKGYDGVVISLTEGLRRAHVEDTRLICEAGVSLKDAAELACREGLGGLEFACGIPGSIGGACFMNAGAYDACIADVLEKLTAITSEGELVSLGVDELDLGYRQSRVAREGLTVLSASFVLEPKPVAEIQARMDELTEKRSAKQPLELPSAGSTFKRPEGYFAGKLISDAGLKGYSVGGAGVSTKHAGFVVNLGGATASDVRAVIAHVQEEVERQFGVRLEPEVRFVGEF